MNIYCTTIQTIVPTHRSPNSFSIDNWCYWCFSILTLISTHMKIHTCIFFLCSLFYINGSIQYEFLIVNIIDHFWYKLREIWSFPTSSFSSRLLSYTSSIIVLSAKIFWLNTLNGCPQRFDIGEISSTWFGSRHNGNYYKEWDFFLKGSTVERPKGELWCGNNLRDVKRLFSVNLQHSYMFSPHAPILSLQEFFCKQSALKR